MNGTYSFVYSGELGQGFGVFTIQDSILTGADFAGGRYKGHVTVDDTSGEFDVIFDMFVPSGMWLVQNVSGQEIDYTKNNIQFHAPSGFGDGEPLKVFIPPGYITLMVKKIPDEYSYLSAGFAVSILPTNPK